jgi:pimeloyl-ACP methyl ester carboxylesterase
VLKASPFMHGPDFTRFGTQLDRGHPARSGAPALLIAGGESEYVQEEDIPLFRRFFPDASVEVIPGCGHWLHYICTDNFLTLVTGFLSGLQS